MSDILVTFLGTGRYEPVRYTYLGKTSEKSESFVQAALVELLQNETNNLQIQPLVTAEVVTHENFAKFKDRVGDRILPEQQIEAPKSEADLWAIFEKVVACVNEGDRVWFDVTHGFRALPIIAVQALTFVRHVKKFSLEGVLYGAFEARANDVAPIFDLTTMLVLAEWGEALGEWRRTGRSDGIVEQTKPYLDKVKNDLRQNAPQDLVGLPQALQTLSAALAIVRSDKQSEWATNVLERIEGARNVLPKYPALAPLGTVVDLIAADVTPLKQHGEESHLRQQLRAAEWYLKRSRFAEAATTLRELLTSGAVVIAVKGGILTVPKKKKSGHVAQPDDADYREAVDFALQIASGHQLDGEPHQQVLNVLKNAPEALKKSAKSALDALRDVRNWINHAWSSSEAKRNKFPARAPLQDIEAKLRTSLSEVRSFVDAVEGLP